MPPIREFMDLLAEMEQIHVKKNQDYAQEGSPFQNFLRSAFLAEWFNRPEDKAFIVLIGTKLARLSTLLNKGSVPNNESIKDSFLDLTTYCALWSSFHAAYDAKERTKEDNPMERAADQAQKDYEMRVAQTNQYYRSVIDDKINAKLNVPLRYEQEKKNPEGYKFQEYPGRDKDIAKSSSPREAE